MNKQLSVIIPCFNPEPNWLNKLLVAVATIEKQLNNVSIEWLIVNDGSITGFDESEVIEAIAESNIKLLSYHKNQGKGAAIRFGAQNAKAGVLMFTDIDFPYRNEDFVAMYHRIAKGDIDVLVAGRDESYYKQIKGSRRLVSKLFRGLIKLVFNIPISDTQAGLKALSIKGKEVLLATTINRYLFDLELIKRAHKNGLVVQQLPVQLKEETVLASLSFGILFSEFKNLIRIIFL